MNVQFKRSKSPEGNFGSNIEGRKDKAFKDAIRNAFG